MEHPLVIWPSHEIKCLFLVFGVHFGQVLICKKLNCVPLFCLSSSTVTDFYYRVALLVLMLFTNLKTPAAMVPEFWLTEAGQSATGALLDYIVENHSFGALLANRAASQSKYIYIYTQMNGK